MIHELCMENEDMEDPNYGLAVKSLEKKTPLPPDVPTDKKKGVLGLESSDILGSKMKSERVRTISTKISPKLVVKPLSDSFSDLLHGWSTLENSCPTDSQPLNCENDDILKKAIQINSKGDTNLFGIETENGKSCKGKGEKVEIEPLIDVNAENSGNNELIIEEPKIIIAKQRHLHSAKKVVLINQSGKF